MKWGEGCKHWPVAAGYYWPSDDRSEKGSPVLSYLKVTEATESKTFDKGGKPVYFPRWFFPSSTCSEIYLLPLQRPTKQLLIYFCATFYFQPHLKIRKTHPIKAFQYEKLVEQRKRNILEYLNCNEWHTTLIHCNLGVVRYSFFFAQPSTHNWMILLQAMIQTHTGSHSAFKLYPTIAGWDV